MLRAAIALLLGGSMILPEAALHAQRNLDEVEITAEQVAPGIAVLFGAGGNIAVGYGGDATVMIDDQFAPLSAKIERAVAALGADPVKYVVNTHWHRDHTGGNEHFGGTGATIFAHHNVRSRLAAGGTAAGSQTPPAPAEALPVVTYDQGIRFHLNGDTINLMFLGGGHTDGDSIVIWREANVVHMGDLYFNTPGYPFIDLASGGNVYDGMRSIDLALAQMDGDTRVIPGHGPLSDKAELVAYRAMMGLAVKRVEALREQGLDLAEALDATPLADFERGEGFIDADAFVAAIWNSAKR
jgi:glyoxylase-like metal-dependent hydrolase (beta-lactamase superfamily II)